MQALGRASVGPCTTSVRPSASVLCPRLSTVKQPTRSQRLVTRVAAIEEQQPQVADPAEAAAATAEVKPHLAPISAAEMEELQIAELDSAQEQLLSWMMNVDEAGQEEELDEMVDYDEFGDEEYEELYEDVEEMLSANEGNMQLKVADKVMGTVYELDDDGAYVEIGQKASGFVPLSECSFAKLKSVSAQGGIRLALRVWRVWDPHGWRLSGYQCCRRGGGGGPHQATHTCPPDAVAPARCP